jgi:hypothetical protein
MSAPILVRGELSVWVHVGRLASALALLTGLILGAIGFMWGWVVAAVGGVLWVVLELVALRARWVRTWLTIQPEGFVAQDRTGSRTVLDAEVVAVTLENKRNFSNAEVTSVTRTFRVWTERDLAPIIMRGSIAAGRIDPVAGLIDRLHDSLLTRMEEDLARGLAVGGDGWQLTRVGLTVGRPPRDIPIPIGEIAAVDLFDGQMCIWRRGQDEAAARLPLSGRNVYLLPALLGSRIAHEKSEPATLGGSGLGRILFQRRPHAGIVYGFLLVGFFLAAIGLALLLLPGQQPEPFFFGLALAPLGALLGLCGAWMRFQNFRVHERGVWQGGLFGQKMLRYEDVGTFRYQAMDHYHEGIYTGTQLTMDFRPISRELGPRIRYSANVRGGDDDLDELRDHVSRAVAGRMAELFGTGQPVYWTSNLQFLPDGIRYKPGGLFGRKEPQLLPYDQYGGHDIQQGVFHLFAQGSPKAICTEQTNVENFFPGLFLLLMLMHSPAEEEVSDAAESG